MSEDSSVIEEIKPQNTPGGLDVKNVPGPNRWLRPTLVGLGYLAFWQVASHINSDSVGAMLISTVVSLGLVIWFTAEVAHTCRNIRDFVLTMSLAAIIMIPLRIMLVTKHVMPPWSIMLEVPGLADLTLVWFGVGFGGLLSYLLRSPNMIPPVAAVLALVDIWTVLLGGPVSKVLTSPDPIAKKTVRFVTVQLPTPKPTGASPMPTPQVVGFADFLFISFFVAAIGRFVPSKKTYQNLVFGLVGVLCSYMLIVFFSGISLPALVPMAVVMIAMHWRQFHYERSELFALLYAGVFIALIGVAFWYFGARPKEMNADTPISAPPKIAPT